jgi:hypothetical protein
MATLGQTTVTISIEEFGRVLEKAAQMGIDSAPTAVELTAKGIAGTIIMETLVQVRPHTSTRG